MRPAIETSGLTKTYPGGLTAVDSLDLMVPGGEIFGLLGPNGAGKTTTIGMLTTRVVPTSGNASVAGVDVEAHPARVKRRIGVVAQTNTLDRSLTAKENLYYHGRYFGMSRTVAERRAGELLDRFQLGHRRNAEVGTLSGGMAQRLMVARALMHEPTVLFLDEPTTGLDPQSRIALWDLLRVLHGEGQTILLTTHYMEEADQLCDRVAIMDHGRILSLGTPAELKRQVGAATIVALTAEGDLDKLASALVDVSGVERAHAVDGQVRVHTATASGLLPPLLAVAERTGYQVADLTVSEPTLETVFIALTGRQLRE